MLRELSIIPREKIDGTIRDRATGLIRTRANLALNIRGSIEEVYSVSESHSGTVIKSETKPQIYELEPEG